MQLESPADPQHQLWDGLALARCPADNLVIQSALCPLLHTPDSTSLMSPSVYVQTQATSPEGSRRRFMRTSRSPVSFCARYWFLVF
ncbi:hypothetical protein EXN66_Car021072 [Channa argus]|uniref:Uncharacterized protein n=1 Tax=Channa argus TaxID=215402 RepID=A0A6G1QRR5_CHAAH|nr:hypothetical protein EXN66_Car021072 [Channa argus]